MYLAKWLRTWDKTEFFWVSTILGWGSVPCWMGREKPGWSQEETCWHGWLSAAGCSTLQRGGSSLAITDQEVGPGGKLLKNLGPA